MATIPEGKRKPGRGGAAIIIYRAAPLGCPEQNCHISCSTWLDPRKAYLLFDPDATWAIKMPGLYHSYTKMRGGLDG